MPGLSLSGIPPRVSQLVRENRLFSAALGAGALLRLITMIGYPGALFFAGDSYVYLGAALRPQPNLSKTTGYSLFLRALEPFRSLTLVAGVQHLMGLGIAVMVYVLALRAGVTKRWATAGALPVLLDGFEIEDEHMLMAEALFTFLVMAVMLVILWRPRIRWPLAAGIGLLAGYAVLVRTEGLPVLLLFPLVVVLHGRPDRRQWLAAGTMLTASLVPVAGYVTWFHHVQGTWSLTRSDGIYLWGRVSSFADCAVIKPPPRLATMCPTGPASKRTPPGDYIWHAPMARHPVDLTGPVSPSNDALFREFAIRAVQAQPLGYVTTVLYDLTLPLRWPRLKYPDTGTVDYYYFHLKPQVVPGNHSWVLGGTAYHDAVQYGGTVPSRVIVPVAVPIALYEQVIYTYGPLFGLIVLTGLGGVVRIRDRRLVWSRRTGSMLPWVTGMVLLIFPIAVADFDYRYLLPVLPFAGLAAALAFAPARTAEKPAEPANRRSMIIA